jgi:hypothetical protein
MEVNVIPISYSKKISENFSTPSFYVLSHQYQLIFLHIVTVCHELETALLKNCENVGYNAIYNRSIG